MPGLHLGFLTFPLSLDYLATLIKTFPQIFRIASLPQAPSLATRVAPQPVYPSFRDARTHGDARHDLQLHEIHDGNAPVGRADVGAQMQIGPQERWPVLPQQHDQSANAQHHGQEVHTKVSWTGHVSEGILPRIEPGSKVARLKPMGAGVMGLGAGSGRGADGFPTEEIKPFLRRLNAVGWHEDGANGC
jgi:hypothetical protein